MKRIRIPHLKKKNFISPDFEGNNLGDQSEVSASDIHGKYDERHCIDEIEDEPMKFV